MKRIKHISLAGSSEQPGTPKHIEVSTITVSDRKREVDPEAVSVIARSMVEIGLLTPITVIYPASTADDADTSSAPVLVVGANRLEAAMSRGWKAIQCVVMDSGGAGAEMWEIAENLHRRDLTKKQRDEHIRRYARLLEERGEQKGQTVPFESQRQDGKGHRQNGIASEIAEDMGVSKRTVNRALANAEGDQNEKTHSAPRTAEEISRSRLTKAWSKACEGDRLWFLNWIGLPEQGGYKFCGVLQEAELEIDACPHSTGIVQ